MATALKAAVLGKGSPGVYNLAGDGELDQDEAPADRLTPARLTAWLAAIR